jgi:hypothetical protein
MVYGLDGGGVVVDGGVRPTSQWDGVAAASR